MLKDLPIILKDKVHKLRVIYYIKHRITGNKIKLKKKLL